LGRRFWIALVTVLGTSGMLAYLAGAAGAATTSYDRTKTILFDGRPTFPLVLSPGPPLGGTTPWGADGLAETASAGVNMYRTGAGGIGTSGKMVWRSPGNAAAPLPPANPGPNPAA